MCGSATALPATWASSTNSATVDFGTNPSHRKYFWECGVRLSACRRPAGGETFLWRTDSAPKRPPERCTRCTSHGPNGVGVSSPFIEDLALVLPQDLPRRDEVIAKSARHLALIVEANQHFNLTRITTSREAAIKHVLDSVLPWRIFSRAEHILDAGSGAGFPGIPLALVLPETRFTLAESIQKRARFLDSVLDALDLHNVVVAPERAEDVLRRRRIDVITARAVAPIGRAIGFFAPALKAGARALLYKGPDADAEILEAAPDATKHKLQLRVVERYELPEAMGSRTIVEIARR